VTVSREVTSVRSDRVTAVRALHARQGRRKTGRFVVEGPQAVRSALAAGVVIRDLFMDDDAGAAFPDIAASARELGLDVCRATPEVLAAMGETAQPQGVLAVCDQLPAGDLDAVMAAPGPVVVLDEVTDPGNVGTVIRTSDAVGAAGVVLTAGSADVHNGKVVRSTAGSLFHLPVLSGLAIATVAEAAARHGRPVVAATGDAAVDLFAAVDDGLVGPRTCWIVGSEAHGVSEAARSAADLALRIPMQGRAESLNAAVAAAVVLYVTAHAATGSGDSGRGPSG
jgi:RNA methyltransferase, TrmH family